MISKETIETFIKVQTGVLIPKGWTVGTPEHQETLRRSVKEAFKAIGVKVEGEPE